MGIRRGLSFCLRLLVGLLTARGFKLDFLGNAFCTVKREQSCGCSLPGPSFSQTFCHPAKGSEQAEEFQTPDDGRLVVFTVNELFILLFYSQIL